MTIRDVGRLRTAVANSSSRPGGKEVGGSGVTEAEQPGTWQGSLLAVCNYGGHSHTLDLNWTEMSHLFLLSPQIYH